MDIFSSDLNTGMQTRIEPQTNNIDADNLKKYIQQQVAAAATTALEQIEKKEEDIFDSSPSLPKSLT